MPRNSGRRIALSFAFLWELLRLGGIYVALIRLVDAQALMQTQLSLLWFGAGQLAVAAGIAAAIYDFGRFHVVLPILALAKALTLVIGAAVLASAALVEPGAAGLEFSVDPYAMVLPLVVVNLDLLSIAFLILFFRAGRTVASDERAGGSTAADATDSIGGSTADGAATGSGAAAKKPAGGPDGGRADGPPSKRGSSGGRDKPPGRGEAARGGTGQRVGSAGEEHGGRGHEAERTGPVQDDELPDFRETQIDEEFEEE